jgi:hypothetical protein
VRLPHQVGLRPSKKRVAYERAGLGAVPIGIGHNRGPRWSTRWEEHCWEEAHKAAWKLPDRQVWMRRLKRAQRLGMSYRRYTLEMMERGKYL